MDNIYDNPQMHYQPTINFGMVGSVSNGKSCVTLQLSKKKTQQHSHEQIKNITIKLGYANAKIFKCNTCPAPQCYQPEKSSTTEANCSICKKPMELKKHISIVDSPGHMMLMKTMLNGTSVMDTTIMVESVSNKDMPSTQTKEHLIAVEMANIPNCAICLNKLDLVNKDKAVKQLEKLQKYVDRTSYKDSPTIPIAANYGLNIDVLCEYICSIPEPVRDLKSNAKMIVIRSFNANRQDTKIKDLNGGVVGGSLLKGVLKIGDCVKILPGFITKSADSSWKYTPIVSKVVSMKTEQSDLQQAIPGGLIGVALTVDPSLTANDKMIGSTLVKVDSEDDPCEDYKVVDIVYVTLEHVKRLDGSTHSLKRKETIMINHNACNVNAKVKKIRGNMAELHLSEKPICVQITDYITLSRNSGSGIEIVARACVQDVEECKLYEW